MPITSIHSIRNQHISIGYTVVPQYGVNNIYYWVLCTVKGQKREQKHTTKKFLRFHNHSPLLTMQIHTVVLRTFWLKFHYLIGFERREKRSYFDPKPSNEEEWFRYGLTSQNALHWDSSLKTAMQINLWCQLSTQYRTHSPSLFSYWSKCDHFPRLTRAWNCNQYSRICDWIFSLCD